MYLLFAQRQKRPPGIFFKNHHEFRPLEENQMLHKRHPSLAGNGNAEVEELKGWGWVLSEPGPALGRATLFQRSGVGRKTLGRGPLPES